MLKTEPIGCAFAPWTQKRCQLARFLHQRSQPASQASRARQRHLRADRRHRLPLIEKVRDMLPGEALEVFGLQPVAVVHLHPNGSPFGSWPRNLSRSAAIATSVSMDLPMAVAFGR
jgi:hypothetical protein